MKLLLNHEYDPVEEAKKEKEEEASKKASLVREHSRRLFTLGQGNLLKTPGTPALLNGDVGGSGDQEEGMEVDGEDKKKEETQKKGEEKKKEEETEDNIEPDGKCVVNYNLETDIIPGLTPESLN